MNPDLPNLPFPVSEQVMSLAKNIKLALFDVDGVLTDGSLHYGENGEQIKVFNALDGHGLKMLQQSGIHVGIITARNSEALRSRMSDLKIEHCFLGVDNKLEVFNRLIAQLNLKPDQCAFTGDDVIDLGVMQQCGLKLSVANGHFIVKQIADWVSPFKGGDGAARSVCDILLYSQNSYPIGTTVGQ